MMPISKLRVDNQGVRTGGSGGGERFEHAAVPAEDLFRLRDGRA